MIKRKKMTPEEKEALVERLKKGKGSTKPRQKKEHDPDPEGKYPKVEIGHWGKNKKRLNKFMDDAFKMKHKEVVKGEERGGEPDKGGAQESAKAPAPTLK